MSIIPVILLLLLLLASPAPAGAAPSRRRPRRRLPLRPVPAGLACGLEPGAAPYDATWNTTSLRACDVKHGRARQEKVCVVGAGSSGVHLAWLLKRRGFNRTVVFERNDRLGGDIFTLDKGSPGGDNITRELGAAFLSPDYEEVRALLARYGQSEEPISVEHMMRFHTTRAAPNGTTVDTAESAKAWYGAWVGRILNTTDPAAQTAAVSAALQRYTDIHSSIFGATYKGRFPPRPVSPSALARLNCTGEAFLENNGIGVLLPLMYQFFVMQGMGLLKTMSAYYMLKWCSPKSLAAGGFGNDHDTPLAMLPEGFGAIVAALAKEVDLDVRLGYTVRSITRSRVGGVQMDFATPAGVAAESCDLLVLSGPIPEFVRGSADGTRPAILTPPTGEEQGLFGGMQAMQFLVSLLEFETPPSPLSFKALEYWPAGYQDVGGVIVRRDIGFAEEGHAHLYGGLQSFSYWPYPKSNRSVHWRNQQQWAKDRGLGIKSVVHQFYVDRYYNHHSIRGVVEELRPWRVDDLQMLEDTRTLYVGGAASYESVEDSIQYNLALVDRLFDQPQANPMAATGEDLVVEQLLFDLPWTGAAAGSGAAAAACDFNSDVVQRFLSADNATWTAFLKMQPGFIRKYSMLVAQPPPTTTTTTSVGAGTISMPTCQLLTYIEWESSELWKSIAVTALERVTAAFQNAWKNHNNNDNDPSPAPIPQPFPASGNGLQVESDYNGAATKPVDTVLGQALEVIRLDFPCIDVERFFAVDNATWTRFLSEQKGFLEKKQLFAPFTSSSSSRTMNCSVYTHVRWKTRALWKSIKGSDLAATQQAFVAAFGYAPTMTRLFNANGFDTVSFAAPEYGPRILAINGNDVVAYHTTLKPGDLDVPGLPQFRRFLNVSTGGANILPSDLLHYHPQPYEFWFSSADNAALFDADPWKYIPAFGGHCTHCIATNNGDTREIVADGRIAFTCVNTTEWAVVDGRLYMNSCSMYADFMKDPKGNIEKASATWASWFGEGVHGPINDACFQDGGQYAGNPVGATIPRKCYLK
jgi:hypothetical protein